MKTKTNTQTLNEHSRNNNNNSDERLKYFYKENNILNVKNIYKSTIINEFKDENFLEPLDHNYNTRRRSEGRFKIPRYTNKHGKSTLNVQLPTTFNSLPQHIVNTQNHFKHKILVKNYLLESQ